MPQPGDLRVWWIPQIPMQMFTVEVRTLREARLVLDTLARYDEFQFTHHVKPDYSNAGGLTRWEKNPDVEEGYDWYDWYDKETGDDFDTYCKTHQSNV